MAETGTSVGEISGQSKPINSCDFRPARPFRIITGSEDNTIAVFEGPPFKFKKTKQVLLSKNVIFLIRFESYKFLIRVLYLLGAWQIRPGCEIFPQWKSLCLSWF